MAKEPTEKQLAARKKFGEAARARAAQRKADKENEIPNETPVEPVVAAPDDVAPEAHDPGAPKIQDVDELQRAVLETIQNLFSGVLPGNQNGPKLTDRGVVGTKERYPIDPTLYPDPRERIADEARLQPVAFKYNYELEYTCAPTRRYQTQDGIFQVEPQFTLELNRIVLDEATGAATNQRYTICRGIFFEDPDTAIMMAVDMGYPIDHENEKAFLDEMRYIRMRDWVMEAFFQPLDTAPKKNKRDIVIDGRQVEIWEVSGEESQKIPFDTLRNKLKV